MLEISKTTAENVKHISDNHQHFDKGRNSLTGNVLYNSLIILKLVVCILLRVLGQVQGCVTRKPWTWVWSSIALFAIVGPTGVNFQSPLSSHTHSSAPTFILSLGSFIWYKMPYSLVDIYERLRETFCLDLQQRKLSHSRKRNQW
jgi:hypothetical protein